MLNLAFFTKIKKQERGQIVLSESKVFKLALFSTSAMTILAGVIVSPALPSIEEYFIDTENASLLVRLIITMPALFVMLFAPLVGILMDKIARLKLLYPSILLWTFAGIAPAFLDDLILILISRALLGLATAFVMSVAMTLLGDYYHDRLDNVLGLQNFIMALLGALATFLGGMLVNIAWQYIFFIYAFGFIVFIACKLYLFEPKLMQENFKARKQAMEYKPFLQAWFLAFLISVIFYLCPTLLPFYIKQYLALGVNFTTIAMALPPLTWGICVLFYKKLSLKLGLFGLYKIAFLCWGFGFLLIALVPNFLAFILALLLIGAGAGLAYTNNPAWILKLAHTNLRARAVSILSSSLFFGQFLSPFISTPLLHNFTIAQLFLGFALVLFMLVFYFYKQEKIQKK